MASWPTLDETGRAQGEQRDEVVVGVHAGEQGTEIGRDERDAPRGIARVDRDGRRKNAGLARQPRAKEDVAGRVDDRNIGGAVAVQVGDQGRVGTDKVNDRRAGEGAVAVAELHKHVVGTCLCDRQVGPAVAGEIARHQVGRIPRSTERERRRGLERAVAVAQVHGVVVGSIAVAVGGRQVEDAVVREIAGDNGRGIYAGTEGEHLVALGSLKGPVAVAQKHVDGIAVNGRGVRAGDRQVGESVVAEIPGHQGEVRRGPATRPMRSSSPG